MKKLTMNKIRSDKLRIGDVVARSVGQVTNIKFQPIESFTHHQNGRVDVYFGKIPIRMMSEDEVWIIVDAKEANDDRNQKV